MLSLKDFTLYFHAHKKKTTHISKNIFFVEKSRRQVGISSILERIQTGSVIHTNWSADPDPLPIRNTGLQHQFQELPFQIGPLDQGFWPDGIYTPPSIEECLSIQTSPGSLVPYSRRIYIIYYTLDIIWYILTVLEWCFSTPQPVVTVSPPVVVTSDFFFSIKLKIAFMQIVECRYIGKNEITLRKLKHTAFEW